MFIPNSRIFYFGRFPLVIVLLGSLILTTPSRVRSENHSATSATLPLELLADRTIPGVLGTTSFPGHFESPQLPPRLDDNLLAASGTDLLSVGFQDNSLYYSHDSGNMWSNQQLPFASTFARALAPSPDFVNDQMLLAGSDSVISALRISNDRGHSWREPLQPLAGPIGGIFFSSSFAVDRTIYIVRYSYPVISLWRSTDGGEHWAQTGVPSQSSAIKRLVLSPYYQYDNTLFALLLDSTLWRSTNGGATWERADTGLGIGSGNSIYALTIAPLNNGGALLFAATAWALVTTFDGGRTWYLVDWLTFADIAVSDGLYIFGVEKDSRRLLRSIDLGGTWHDMLPGQQLNEVALSPGFTWDGAVFANNSSSLWASNDGGQNWYSKSRPPRLFADYAGLPRMVVSPGYSEDRTIFLYHNLLTVKSIDGGYSWTRLDWPTQPPGPNPATVNLAVSPDYPRDQRVIVSVGNSLYQSTNGGSTWTPIGGALPITPNLLKTSPAFPGDQTLFIASYGGGVYRSTNGGQSWSLITNGLSGYVVDFDISPQFASDTTLFVTIHNDGIFRSDNNAGNWTQLPKPNFSSSYIVELSPSFSQDQVVFAAADGSSGGGIFRSDNRGNSWANISGGFPAGYISGVAVSSQFYQDRTVIVGRRDGPYFVSEDSGASWSPLTGYNAFNRRNSDLAIVYEQNRVQPLGIIGDYFYRYHWPALSAQPARPTIGLAPGITGPVRSTLELISDGADPRSWTVNDDVDWLSVEPLTGTGPISVTLVVDSTLITDAVTANVAFQLEWTSVQSEFKVVPVIAFWIHHQMWLPLVHRQSNKYVIGNPGLVQYGGLFYSALGLESLISERPRFGFP